MDVDKTGAKLNDQVSDESIISHEIIGNFLTSKRKKVLYVFGVLTLLLAVFIMLLWISTRKNESTHTPSSDYSAEGFEIGSIISVFRESYPDIELAYVNDTHAITVGSNQLTFDWDSYYFSFVTYDKNWTSLVEGELLASGFSMIEEQSDSSVRVKDSVYSKEESYCTIAVSSPNEIESGGFTFSCTASNQNKGTTEDSAKYVSGEFATCADLDLQDKYLFLREQWNDENRLIAENHICAVHPLLVQHYGESFNAEGPIMLRLDIAGIGEYGGMSNIDTITLARVEGESSLETFTHELVHAFRGETHFLYSVFEEGSARAMQVFITKKLGKESKVVDARMQLASLLNQSYITTGAGSIREDDGTTDIAGLRYQLAGVAFLKIIQEDPYFFTKFHQVYYPAFKSDASIQSDYRRIVDLIADVKPIIEGVPTETWFEGQYVFQGNDTSEHNYPYIFLYTGATQNAFTVQSLIKYPGHESIYSEPIHITGEIARSDNLVVQRFELNLNQKCGGDKKDSACSEVNNYVEIDLPNDYMGLYKIIMDATGQNDAESSIQSYAQYGYFNLELARMGLYGFTEDTTVVRVYDSADSLIAEVEVTDNRFSIDGLPNGTYTLADKTGNKRLVVTKVTDVQAIQF